MNKSLFKTLNIFWSFLFLFSIRLKMKWDFKFSLSTRDILLLFGTNTYIHFKFHIFISFRIYQLQNRILATQVIFQLLFLLIFCLIFALKKVSNFPLTHPCYVWFTLAPTPFYLSLNILFMRVHWFSRLSHWKCIKNKNKAIFALIWNEFDILRFIQKASRKRFPYLVKDFIRKEIPI